MNIVVMGPKGAGKSTLGMKLSSFLGIPFVDTDKVVEELHARREGGSLSCREIFLTLGEEKFRALERDASKEAAAFDYTVIITGGELMMDPNSRKILRAGNILVWLHAAQSVLWERATRHGVPPWLQGEDGEKIYTDQTTHREDVLQPYADIVLDTTSGAIDEAATPPRTCFWPRMRWGWAPAGSRGTKSPTPGPWRNCSAFPTVTGW